MEINYKKIFNVLSSTFVAGALLLSGGISSYAENSVEDIENIKIENIQSIYYEVDGVEYEVPEDEYENFINGEPTPNLPGISDEKQESNSENQPAGDACEPGYEIDGKRDSAGFVNKKSGEPVINKTRDNLTETSILTSTQTISGSVTGSGDFDWGVIEASVGFDIGGSFTWSKSESTAITVRPGDWGWIQYGTYNENWSGDYYYLTRTCGKDEKTYLKVKGPKTKAKLAYTEAYPG